MINQRISSKLFFIPFVIMLLCNNSTISQSKGNELKWNNFIKVIYFHGENRCHTCLTIEAYSKETVENAFEKELKEKKVVWDAINYDVEKNAHYMDDFQLYAQALIVIRYKDGKQAEWKSLEKVWELVHEKEKFQTYVKQEIKKYLKKL